MYCTSTIEERNTEQLILNIIIFCLYYLFKNNWIRVVFIMGGSPGDKLCSFCNISVTSPTSQLILQPFRRFTYVTVHSPTLPLLHIRHSSFSNPSFASPTSQALHLIHLAKKFSLVKIHRCMKKFSLVKIHRCVIAVVFNIR